MMDIMKYDVVLVGLMAAAALAASADDVRVEGLGADAGANRAAIQRAVDRASAQGGGRVVLPVGTWLSGSVELKNGVELHVPKGTVLKGSTERRDYNANDAFPENKWSDAEEWSGGHLVWARCATNIAITGGGTIDGSGSAFFGACDEDSRWPWYKYGLKLHPTDREWFRPGMMVAFFRCRGIRLADVTLANPPAWTCHLRCCDGVTIRGVTIDADRTIANSDGFSIDCTRNVTVERCVLKTGDDGFAIRAACALHASTNFCENIVIRDCDVWSCCSGIRFGIGSGTIRRVRVSDVRIHEAADAGVGFTPAWITGKRNCYIEDIELRDCTVSDCERPVSAGATGNSLIADIRFANCVFNTLLPSLVWGGDRCRIDFSDCVRNTIDRVKVRHRWQWKEREIRNGRSVFADVRNDKSKVRITNCRPLPYGSAGVLLLCFDGRGFDGWDRSIPLFAKYGAHATFFVDGAFDAPAVRTAKRLTESGHAIGLRGPYSATVKRQCDVAYVPVRTFACPPDRRDGASEKALLGLFDRLRTERADGCLRADDDRFFIPVAGLPGRRILATVPLDEADVDVAVRCIRRAGERKEALVLSAGSGLKPDRLEQILAAAGESGVAVLSFDELPVK